MGENLVFNYTVPIHRVRVINIYKHVYVYIYLVEAIIYYVIESKADELVLNPSSS